MSYHNANKGEEMPTSSSSYSSSTTTTPEHQFAGLHYVTTLVDSLLSFSRSFRSLPGKWQTIHSRLHRLVLALDSVAGSTTSTSSSSIGNLVLQELLQDISATLSDTHEIARVTAGVSSFPGGRLLTLSNLDLAIAKLELHSKSLAGLYASGILACTDAVFALPHSSTKGHEEPRLYVRHLCSRLRIGNVDVKSRALAALNDALRDDEGYARIVAAEVPEALELLVNSLEIRDVGIQEEAAEAVSVISGFDCHTQSLAAAGSIPALVKVLENGSELGKERAARTLKNLTEKSDNAWAVSANDGVTILLQVVHEGTPVELLGSACGVLKNLLGVPEIRAFMMDHGIVMAFLKLLRSGEDAARMHAIEFLLRISTEDDAARAEALREGVVESLVRAVDPACSSTSKTREVALRAIEALCNPTSSGALMSSGFLERVLALLRSGCEVSVQESALKAVSRFLGVSEEARRAMGEAGFMRELVNLLDDGARSIGVREVAAEALSSIVSVHRNQRRFVEEDDGNVRTILQVLVSRSDEKPLTTKFLLSALASLSDSNAGRRKIAASGYVRSLEKMSDGDARRIVKKVSAGRLRSLLHGFWGIN